jgi:hypothetical protein
MIEVFKGAVTFFSQAPVEDKAIAILFLFLACYALLFQALWFREHQRNKRYSRLENKISIPQTGPKAKTTLIRFITRPNRESLGRLIRKASSIASCIFPSTQKVKRPTATDTTQLIHPISAEYNTREHSYQSKDTK